MKISSDSPPSCNGAHLPPGPEQHMSASNSHFQLSAAGPSVPQTASNSNRSDSKGPVSNQDQAGGRAGNLQGVSNEPGLNVKREEEGGLGGVLKEESADKIAVDHGGSSIHVPGGLKQDPDEPMADVGVIKEEKDEMVKDESLGGKEEANKVVEDPQELLQVWLNKICTQHCALIVSFPSSIIPEFLNDGEWLTGVLCRSAAG